MSLRPKVKPAYRALWVIRCTKLGSYVLPTDTFGHQYAEPYLDVGIGSAIGGKVPVTWLGRPQAHLHAGRKPCSRKDRRGRGPDKVKEQRISRSRRKQKGWRLSAPAIL